MRVIGDQFASRAYGWYFRHGLQNRRGGWRTLQLLRSIKPIVPIQPDAESTVWVDVRSANALVIEMLCETTPYEPQLQALFRRVIRPTDTVVDVGANIGLHTVLFDRLAAKVFAVEPHPLLQRALRKTVSGLRHTTVYACALADFNGEAPYRVEGDHSGGALATTGQMVAVRRLDDVVGNDRVDFMKIDVEGHELGVLRGGEQTIRRCAPVVVFEQFNKTGPGAHDFLAPLGYRFQAITRTGDYLPWSIDIDWCDVLAVPPHRHELLGG